MSTQQFSHTQYPVIALVEQIDTGELSLGHAPGGGVGDGRARQPH